MSDSPAIGPVTSIGSTAQNSSTPYAVPVHATAKAAAAAPEQDTEDPVTLSETAQASALFEIGRSPTEISQALGIPISTVEDDLGIAAAIVNTLVRSATAS